MTQPKQRNLFDIRPAPKPARLKSVIPVWIKRDPEIQKRQALLADRLDDLIREIAKQKYAADKN